MPDDIATAREVLRDKCRRTGMSRREAQVRSEASIRRVVTKIERGENPEPGSSPKDRNRR